MHHLKSLLIAVLFLVLPATAHAACNDGSIAQNAALLHGTSFIPLTDRLGQPSTTPREPAWFADDGHREFAIHAGARYAGPGATEMNIHHYTATAAIPVRICATRDEFIADQDVMDATFTFDAGDEDRTIARHFCAAATSAAYRGYQINADEVRAEPEYILCTPPASLTVGAVNTLPLTIAANIITITDGLNVYELNTNTLGFVQTQP